MGKHVLGSFFPLLYPKKGKQWPKIGTLKTNNRPSMAALLRTQQEHALGDVMPPLVTVHIGDLFCRRSSDLFAFFPNWGLVPSRRAGDTLETLAGGRGYALAHGTCGRLAGTKAGLRHCIAAVRFWYMVIIACLLLWVTFYLEFVNCHVTPFRSSILHLHRLHCKQRQLTPFSFMFCTSLIALHSLQFFLNFPQHCKGWLASALKKKHKKTGKKSQNIPLTKITLEELCRRARSQGRIKYAFFQKWFGQK